MARRSRNPIGRLAASGPLLLSLVLATGAARAVTLESRGAAATHTATKADSAKSHAAAKPAATAAKTAAQTTTAAPGAKTPAPVAAAKTPAAAASKSPATAAAKTPATSLAKTAPSTTPATTAAKPVSGPSATTGVSAKPAAPKPVIVPRSRLATLPTPAPTRATAMPHPEALRAALARQSAPVRSKTEAHAWQTAGATKTATQSAPPAGAAGPRGAVTLTPAKPVPMGIPMGDAKLANGKPAGRSDARAMAAGATGLGTLSAAKGVQAPAGKGTNPSSAQVARLTPVTADRQGSVTPLPKTAPTRAPTVSMGKGVVVPTPPALEDQVTYQYNMLGRRDPFNSLLEGEFVGDDQGGDAPPDLGGLKVVGIMWGSEDQFAMVEDVKGNSFVLRRGDKVMNGFVEGLKRDAMIVNLTVDGQSQSVTIPITRKGEKSNANR